MKSAPCLQGPKGPRQPLRLSKAAEQRVSVAQRSQKEAADRTALLSKQVAVVEVLQKHRFHQGWVRHQRGPRRALPTVAAPSLEKLEGLLVICKGAVRDGEADENISKASSTRSG